MRNGLSQKGRRHARRASIALGYWVVTSACGSAADTKSTNGTGSALTAPLATSEVPRIRPDTNILRRLMTDAQSCQQPAAQRTRTSVLRSGGGVPLSAGRIAIFDRGEIGIVVIDRDGRELKRFGRKGVGPGEFSATAVLPQWIGDTIAVNDQQTMRLTLFTPDGNIARTVNLGEVRGLGSMTWVLGATSAGRVYALVLAPELHGENGRAIYRGGGFMKVFMVGGAKAEILRKVYGASMSRGALPSDWVLQAGFQKSTFYSVSDNVVAIMDNATSLIELYAPDGTPSAVVDLGIPLPRVTESDVGEYMEHARENLGESIFRQARDAFRWDSTHALAAGLSVKGDAVWVRLQARTYVDHRLWVRISMDGAITNCVSQDDEWRLVLVTDSEIVFTREADAGVELIRQPIGVIRPPSNRGSQR